MSKVCDICTKGPATGNTVSHSVRRVKRRFLPNLFKRVVEGVKMKVCTRCLRTMAKPTIKIKAKNKVKANA